MDKDFIDHLISQWKSERPDLDATPMAVVGRILRLSTHLDRRVNEVLKPFGLALWGFDILATLRRSGSPYAMTPTELMDAVMLSSGAMTNRIDRLEQLDFVERKPSPSDRRSLQVKLTKRGRKIIDDAIAARFAEADQAQTSLKKQDRKQLADLLRTLLHNLDHKDETP
ncbi:MarR family winged helix-turn-helix transcriptional regulator [Gimesia fumaroli]|uniref:Multiple antibiotic resistance protein MarR n=1 Tax=Gimesia fumaroli TaxID=2527976 RepID=A0A518IDG1_9PLAN|nr:MarR family transcriptional regulator [Gimesia fumaroli]QDV51142.1 Multiple antibiotic resistance protein MarR [Gimesia fumaroli]